MSADNGVYILKSKNPSGEGCEYRVAYAMGIDNIYWDPETGEEASHFQDLEANRLFGACEVYTDVDEAWKVAWKEGDRHPILEYGVSMLEHPDQVFKPMLEEETVAERARVDRLVEARAAEARKARAREEARKEAAAMVVSNPGQVMEVSSLYGFLILPSGNKIHGCILGGERFQVSFPKPVKFLPTNWDQKGGKK